MGLFNRIQPDRGFVSPVRSGPVRSDPGFVSPTRSYPIQSNPGFVNGLTNGCVITCIVFHTRCQPVWVLAL